MSLHKGATAIMLHLQYTAGRYYFYLALPQWCILTYFYVFLLNIASFESAFLFMVSCLGLHKS